MDLEATPAEALRLRAGEAYARQSRHAMEEQWILQYLPLVRHIVTKTVESLSGRADVDDLISAFDLDQVLDEALSGPTQTCQWQTASENLQWLLKERHRRSETIGTLGPWVVPYLIKTAHTLADMETFFDRWTHLAGHAVIQPATTGCGLMPDLSPVNMAPPRRAACRQLTGRMTLHSDARIPRCDQDWLTRAPAGNAAE